MVSFSPVHPGDPMQAHQVQQIIDALSGTPGLGVPLSPTQVSDSVNYALSVENIDPTNSRALNVTKADGTTLIRADVNGVNLGNTTISGTVAMPAGSITSAMLGPDVARQNLLVNGGFETWQRGNGPFTTSYGPDRWVIGTAGTDTLSVAADTTHQDAGSNRCAACTFGLGSGAGGTSFYQYLSSAEWNLATTLSVSFRVRTSTANAVRIGGYNGSAYVWGAYHPGDGAYHTLTQTWTVTTGTASYVAVNFVASCTAYIDNVCLVYGSGPANFYAAPPADELARAQRYYQTLGGGGTADLYFTGYASAGGQNNGGTLFYLSQKPVVPTVTKVGTWNVANCGQPVVYGIGQQSASMYATSTAVGNVAFYSAGSAAGYVTIEANP